MGDRTKSWRRGLAEVVLIAAGVLLGLVADEWRQDVERSRQERLLLTQLHDEFVANRAELIGVGRTHARVWEQAVSLLDQDGRSADSTDLVLGRILYVLGQGSSFTPQTGTLTSYLNDRGPELISNPDLRAAVADWPRRLAELDIQEGSSRDFLLGDARRFINEHGDLLALLAASGPSRTGELGANAAAARRLASSQGAQLWTSLLEDRQFRNLVATRMRLAQAVLSKQEEVLEAHVLIIDLLVEELGGPEGSL